MTADSRATGTPASESLDIVLDLVNHLDAMVAYWDAQQVCVFANDAYQAWFGKTGAEIIGHTLAELLGPLYALNLPYIQGAYAGQTQVFERAIPTPAGGVRHSLATYTPRLVDGQVRGIFVHVADVSPLKKLERELQLAKAQAEHLATHDFLTGLPNRVLMLDRIVQALAAAKRQQQMVGVLSLDIDDFKQINDQHGHGAGDQVLIESATRMRDALRESDSVTRMGGDEFLVLAPQIETQAQVEALAARLLETVRQPLQLAAGTVTPTFSLGIALYAQDGLTPEALIANSDRALYAAKRLGKNCFAFVPNSQSLAAA
jgi:diguanylate cyclase (GGDEF)-like protein/PAS domain S-box-containing protein